MRIRALHPSGGDWRGSRKRSRLVTCVGGSRPLCRRTCRARAASAGARYAVRPGRGQGAPLCDPAQGDFPLQAVVNCTWHHVAMSPPELPGHCPPSEASPAGGRFYRLATRDSIPGERPKPATWTLPINTKKSAGTDPNVCSSFSLSIYSNAETLIAAARLVPWAKGKPICELKIPEGCGRLLETPGDLCEGHHDWWPEPLDFIPEATVMAA